MAERKSYQNQSVVDHLNVEFGKLPPQAIELEETVLGAIMLEKDAFDNVVELLRPESFYKEVHQKIYKAIVDLSTKEEAIDILTVTEELRKKGQLEEVGGPYFITQLTRRVTSGAHAEFHARIVAQKYIQRELIRVSSEIQVKAYDQSIDVLELLEFSEMELFQVAEGNIKKQTQKIGPLINEAIKQIQAASKQEDGLSGVPSGFTAMDRITSGFQRSDLIIIAARPSMGKTAFVLSIARNVAVDMNRGVAFFSLEMSSIQLVNRLISAESELPSQKIRNGRLEPYEWVQLDDKIKNLTKAPMFIDDTPAISIFELRAKCRRLMKQNENLQLIIIDYLQLMTAGSDMRGNREQEVSIISRSLKALAKELDVPIIALSQLNRSVETRGGTKRPQLSDLRESGAIEQDADLVCMIHRPEYYGFETDDNGQSIKGIAEIIIAKHRNGAVGDVQLKFQKELAKFTDLEDGGGAFPDGYTKSSRINMESEDVAGYGNNEISRNDNFEEAPF
ncbi:MAG: replicative DNA helicase [Bacteroidales bacterium]|nr:replicative DNA helicase [Bacteroidales bacterium]MCF8456216.1 replicative DNA helicase [Bacteroidales bacterium]